MRRRQAEPLDGEIFYSSPEARFVVDAMAPPARRRRAAYVAELRTARAGSPDPPGHAPPTAALAAPTKLTMHWTGPGTTRWDRSDCAYPTKS